MNKLSTPPLSNQGGIFVPILKADASCANIANQQKTFFK